MKNLFSLLLTVTLTCGALLTAPLASAQTDRLIIENGNSASSNEAARQSKEQWNDTKNLRNKVNTRVEKEFDKTDKAFDTRDSCEKSYNVNAYWEPNTLRCLDRRTGRTVAP
ncbi:MULTISPECIES: DUF1283 family protein [Pantoea]|uniref:UPF0482 protein F3J37_00010 n=1 Tax=Candidatus Pantoea communis TaxID=2608354 RepID=A0ABX0RHF8_9GAMM|nr:MULTISPECIES: DUF1283 family protein [Pantoea]KJV47591.1 hypothetical protein VH86_14895 [Pantoea sp. BL1]MDI6935924.1 DUF1283 family protein [Serratia sp. Se-PFBMAAmG]NIG17061.1 DUF1283 family protein [Pantoea communis]